jgi:hypothetical protein
MKVAKINLAQSLESASDVCLEKFRSAEAAAPTFRYNKADAYAIPIFHISINYIGQRS